MFINRIKALFSKAFNILKKAVNALYYTGVVIVSVLVCLFVLSFPLRLIQRESFMTYDMLLWLSVCAFPMIFLGAAYWIINGKKHKSFNKKRDFALIFLPGFVCLISLLYTADFWIFILKAALILLGIILWILTQMLEGWIGIGACEALILADKF